MGRVSCRGLSSNHLLNMKLLVILSLAATGLATWDDEGQVKKWAQMKAYESCFGEDNMKLYTVNMKKAIVKCTQQDAPELSLPPYRSTYRFVNSMLSGADSMDRSRMRQAMEMMEFMSNMNGNQYDRYNKHSGFRPYASPSSRREDGYWMKKMMMKFMFEKMMDKMESPMQYDSMSKYDSMDSKYDTMGRADYVPKHDKMNKYDMMEMMKRFVDNSENNYGSRNQMMKSKHTPETRMTDFMQNMRFKRQAGGQQGLDLGDRLVEKLNHQKEEMQNKIGNMTCVLRELDMLNNNNELDPAAMKQHNEEYQWPSQWLRTKYEDLIDVCYSIATNLPGEVENAYEVQGDFGKVNIAQVKTFMECCNKGKGRMCMYQDIKNKIETNFGPLEEILEQTQLTEEQLFPLVIQLLHGEEMEYFGES